MSSELLERAFELLKAAARSAVDEGKVPYGAWVKSRMLLMSGGQFSERDLGFGSFKGFLQHAEELGLIEVRQPAQGLDILVALPGTPSIASDVRDSPRSHRVRPDIWRAFVDWDPSWRRWFDRDDQVAFMLTLEPTPYEDPLTSRRRLAIIDSSDRFVPIAPIPFLTQRGWMEELSAALPESPLKQGLRAALDSAKPANAFSRVISADYVARGRWNEFRATRVIEIIEGWRVTNGLSLDIFVVSASTAIELNSERLRLRSHDIRAYMHRLIDQLTIEELVKLRIPLGFLVDDN